MRAIALDWIAEDHGEGTPVVAICGKVWVPSRDPDKYPICKTCAEIKAELDARKSN